MKKIVSLVILLSMVPSISRADDCQSYSPCSTDYWTCMDGNVEWNENPATFDPFGSSMPTPAAPSLKKIGSLLYTNSSEELLVFPRGVGEYNEVYNLIPYNNEHLTESLENASASGLNMVRIFVSSGDAQIDASTGQTIFPFVSEYSSQTHRSTFHLHEYNDAYFTRLNTFLGYAETRGISVLLTLFDFAEDISWADDAWNSDNNDHSGLSGFDTYYKNQMFDIWTDGARSQLNKLGITQRDFVLKVVRTTRGRSNVIYEIANEPKEPDMSKLEPWVQQIATWVCNGYGITECDGAPNHLRAVTMPYETPQPTPPPGYNTATPTPTPIGGSYNRTCFLAEINTPVMTSTPCPTGTSCLDAPDQYIHIYGEHDAYRGAYTYERDKYLFQGIDGQETCSSWEKKNLSLNRQSALMDDDLKNLTNYSMALLCDTDGLHRLQGGTGGQSKPYGRACPRNGHLKFPGKDSL